jgi:peptidoglycan/LPS O-acetylase OafA/YrhL
MSIEKNYYLPQLDLLRLLAALMVCVGHIYDASIGWWGYPAWMCSNNDVHQLNPSVRYIDVLFRNLGFGVDIFFIISGFLITYILLKEKEMTGKIDFKRFYIRRTLRIWPLYFLLIALAPMLVSWFHEKSPNYLANIFFVGNFAIIKTKLWEFPFAHFWSICVEEHFYLIWPFVVAFVPIKRLPAAIIASIAISIFYRAFVVIFQGGDWFTLYLNSISRIDVILVGAILAYVHFKRPIKLSFSVGFRLVIYSIFTLIFVTEPGQEWSGLYNACVRKYFYSAMALFMIANYLFNVNPIFNFKKPNFLHYLGRISYGIYMYGNIVLFIVIHKLFLEKNYSNHYIFTIVTLVFTIIVSIISYELFEKWILRFKKRFEVVKTTNVDVDSPLKPEQVVI